MSFTRYAINASVGDVITGTIQTGEYDGSPVDWSEPGISGLRSSERAENVEIIVTVAEYQYFEGEAYLADGRHVRVSRTVFMENWGAWFPADPASFT